MNPAPEVLSFFHADTGTWSHIVVDPITRIAAIIDPVLDFDPASGRIWTEAAQHLLACVRDRDLHVEWLLETHTHADHLSAADWLRRSLLDHGMTPRIAIGIGVIGTQHYFREVFALGPEFATDGSQFDRLCKDGEQFQIGNLDVKVIATPGHTQDGISYLIGDAVFVGDTLFAPETGTGRCDFPGGDAAAQYLSIRRLYDLPDTTRVFFCHDYPSTDVQPKAQSTIVLEKAANIHLKGGTTEADYVALRTHRDTILPAPRLLYPSLQVNICAGRLPAADDAGRIFLRSPVYKDP